MYKDNKHSMSYINIQALHKYSINGFSYPLEIRISSWFKNQKKDHLFPS